MIKRVKVRQIDVARLVGVNRCTVSKVLNNFPEPFNEETKQKVFKAAAQIGYLHPSVVKPQRRKVPRKKFKANASIKVRLQNGSLCSECQGEVVNISTTGMLLRLLDGKRNLFPGEPFYLEINLTNPRLQVPKLKARPVRFDQKRNRLGLGVQFFDLPKDDDQLLKLIVQSKDSYRKKEG